MKATDILEDLLLEQAEGPDPYIRIERNERIKKVKKEHSKSAQSAHPSSFHDITEEIIEGVKSGSIFYDS